MRVLSREVVASNAVVEVSEEKIRQLLIMTFRFQRERLARNRDRFVESRIAQQQLSREKKIRSGEARLGLNCAPQVRLDLLFPYASTNPNGSWKVMLCMASAAAR